MADMELWIASPRMHDQQGSDGRFEPEWLQTFLFLSLSQIQFYFPNSDSELKGSNTGSKDRTQNPPQGRSHGSRAAPARLPRGLPKPSFLMPVSHFWHFRRPKTSIFDDSFTLLALSASQNLHFG